MHNRPNQCKKSFNLSTTVMTNMNLYEITLDSTIQRLNQRGHSFDTHDSLEFDYPAFSQIIIRSFDCRNRYAIHTQIYMLDPGEAILLWIT